MSGAVFIPRDLFDNPAFKREPMTEREAFIWMVMEARWKPDTRRFGNVTVELKRGQLSVSVRFLAEAWGWSKSRVDRFLSRVSDMNLVCVENGTGVNVITLCNYDDYQGGSETTGTAAGQQRDSSGTKEKKGERRGKKEEGYMSDELALDAQEQDATEKVLTEFYAVFPKRNDGKHATPAAIRPVLRQALKKISAGQLILCAMNYANSDGHKNGEYALKATNWLKNEEWEKYERPVLKAVDEEYEKQRERYRRIIEQGRQDDINGGELRRAYR